MLTTNQRLILEQAADTNDGVISWFPPSLPVEEHTETLCSMLILGFVQTDGTWSLTATGYNAIGRPLPSRFYADLIKEEEGKLNSLKRRVAICEQIIASLRGAESTAPVSEPIARSRDVIAPVVLAYLGKKGKTMDELSEYMKSSGYSTSRASLRTLLMNLRKQKGFVDNPRHGFYKLSVTGEKALSA